MLGAVWPSLNNLPVAENPVAYACSVTRVIMMNWMAKWQMHTLVVVHMHYF